MFCAAWFAAELFKELELGVVSVAPSFEAKPSNKPFNQQGGSPAALVACAPSSAYAELLGSWVSRLGAWPEEPTKRCSKEVACASCAAGAQAPAAHARDMLRDSWVLVTKLFHSLRSGSFHSLFPGSDYHSSILSLSCSAANRGNHESGLGYGCGVPFRPSQLVGALHTKPRAQKSKPQKTSPKPKINKKTGQP